MSNYVLAVYKRNEEYDGGIFGSWESYHKYTFSPEIETVFCYDFTTSGKTYADRKEFVREYAIEWSNVSGLGYCWSYGELDIIESEFRRLGKQYGLLREFQNNCIC